jgi:hypothetical protein
MRQDRESGSVYLLVLFLGYLVLGTTMMWFIVDGISGESVNYVKLPGYSYRNTTTSINFTQAQPSDLFVTGAPGSVIGIGPKFIWSEGAGMVAKPYPLFPAYIKLKGLIPESDGYIFTNYTINNSVHKPLGFIITSPDGWDFATLQYIKFDTDRELVLVPRSNSDLDASQFIYTTAVDYLQLDRIHVATRYNPNFGYLEVWVDGVQLLGWQVDNTDNAFYGGVIAWDEDVTLESIPQMKSVIQYDPQTDIVGQSLNFGTFIFQIATFTAPTDLFPPPFVSILIPALFFYLPLLGLLAAVINILWPVI